MSDKTKSTDHDPDMTSIMQAIELAEARVTTKQHKPASMAPVWREEDVKALSEHGISVTRSSEDIQMLVRGLLKTRNDSGLYDALCSACDTKQELIALSASAIRASKKR